MRKFSYLLVLSLFALVLSVFKVSAEPVINLNLLTPTVVCSTGNDTARYSVSATEIPANTNIVIYQSTDSLFNPYLGQGDSIGYIPGTAIPRDTVNFGSCVKTLGIFIDACGASGLEAKNEYIIMTSGNGIKVSNLAIDFSSQNNLGVTNADINTGTNSCSFKIPTPSLITNLQVGSCNASNVIAANPTDSIPANAIILCFTSDNVTANYSINGLCNLGYPIYVVQSACERTIGAFTNDDRCDAPSRYRSTIVTDKRLNCRDNFTYDLCGIFDKNGTYAIRQQGIDTASVTNNGIRKNIIDSCGGIDYTQLDFSADTTLKFRIPTNFCNDGFHYIKAITHPNGTQPVSNTIQYKLVCNDVTAQSATTNICSGESAVINISSTDPNATFSWTVSGGAGISGASAGTGNTINQVLTYSGNTKDSVTYTAISNDAGCTKTQTVKVVVNKCIVCTPDFTAPDTVCVGDNITLTNLSANCATTNYWNFCSGNLDNTPAGTNLGNPGGQLSSPVYTELVDDNNVKYAFVVNHVTSGGAGNGEIVRLNYGSSYLNTPTITNLGDLGISNNIKLEGIQIKKDAGGNWYGFLCTGGESFSKIVRMSFGNSLNNTPTATDLGVIGNLNFPGGLYLYQENNDWYAFITNALNDNLVRLSFGTSLSNIPTATNTTVSGLNNLGEFTFTEDNGNKYMFLNSTLEHKVNRLSFGNSYLNTPTLQSYDIPVNSDNYGIKILKDCGTTFGFITHINNTITKMEFPDGISGNPTFTNIGNIGTLNFPHSISNIFRNGDSVYMFIPNVNSNSLSRLVFGNCTNSSIPSSTQVNPPLFSYNQEGTYNVSLTIDEGLPNQNTICKSIVVVGTVQKPDARINQVTCTTDSIRLSVANVDASAAYSWSGPNGFSSNQPNVAIKFSGDVQAGQYVVTTTGKCNTQNDTVSFSVPSLSLQITGNAQLCNGNTVTLVANGTFDSVRWSTGVLANQLPVTIAGIYTATGYLNGCVKSTTVNVTSCQQQICNPTITGNLPFCDGDSVILNAGNGFTTYLWNTGASTQTITVKSAGKYVVTVTGDNCTGADSVLVTKLTPPAIFSLGNDTAFCGTFSKVLSTGNQQTQWSTDITAAQITVTEAGTYIATINNDCGSVSDTIIITKHELPVVDLGRDTAFCEGELVLSAPSELSSYVWSTGTQGSSITVTEPGTYSVTVIDGNGCSGGDEIIISSNCANDLWVPNAFTPNNDGINDVFYVRGNPRNTTIERFVVYNRWGIKVFEANNILPDDISKGWNGTFKGEPSQFEVYGYEVVARFNDGNKKTLKGNITLLK